MCLYNRLLRNGKYVPNKKNGGIVPQPTDPRVLYVPVGCGECMECRKQKARDWQARLLEDIKENRNGIFVTLTFSNESIEKLWKEDEKLSNLNGYELDNALATKAVRLFTERWRKQYKKAPRHWLITELGHNGTENVHLHGIIWTNEGGVAIEKHWQYGYVWNGISKDGKKQNYVNGSTIGYITKYIMKQDEKHKKYKPRILSSKGIGRNYMGTQAAKRNQYNPEGTKETYRTENGQKIALPIYWRNKIYSELERERLWIEKLDKGERWICGEKVRAKDLEEQRKLREWYRQRNGEMGYGNGSTEDEEYENALRQLMIEKRVNPNGYPKEWDE